jgi:esterase/lipase superfamily enzyme
MAYKEEYFKWHSPNLGTDFEMSVYGHGGQPVVIFPTTMGRYFESKDFNLIESASWFLEQGKVQIFAVDSIDKLSWYNKEIHPAKRVENHNWYDKMIFEEVVGKIRHNTPSGKVVVAGPSFGGYQAANFAFRHPEVVSHLFSMSGAFNVTTFLDGHYDDNVYFNNPVDYLPNLDNPYLNHIKIVLGTSDWDICKDSNLELSHILNQKGIDHWLDMRKWAKHDWPIWRDMFPHYLSLI